MQHQNNKNSQERNDEPKDRTLIREALSPVSPRLTEGCGAKQSNALLRSHINTINITHTISLQQSGLGQANEHIQEISTLSTMCGLKMCGFKRGY